MILADCGNTAVKLADGAERVRLAPAEVAGWLAGRHGPLVLLPTARAGADAVRRAWSGPIREAGVEPPLPDLGQYPGMGPDRIVAGLAAGPGCIVIDAGTATTLTAWDAAGRCAGGLILPGKHALIAGLVACAPALPRVEPLGPGASAAQRSTEGAIAAAAGIGHPAMVRACLERLRGETGLGRVVATGGGAADLGIIGAELRPWLVLEGLARLADGPPLSAAAR